MPTGDVDARVHINTAMALGNCRLASPMLSHLNPQGKPPVLIFREAEWIQDQSGHKGVKKNLHPSNTQVQTWAILPVDKHLAA